MASKSLPKLRSVQAFTVLIFLRVYLLVEKNPQVLQTAVAETLGWRRAQRLVRLVPESIAEQAMQAHSGKMVRWSVK